MENLERIYLKEYTNKIREIIIGCWVMEKVIESSKLVEYIPQKVTVGDFNLALFRVEDNVYALDDLCTHAEASLSEGEVFDCKIECPLHGAEFDLKSGEAVTPPATKDVKTYETVEKDGWIYINF